jgi:hypothetical protein
LPFIKDENRYLLKVAGHLSINHRVWSYCR